MIKTRGGFSGPGLPPAICLCPQHHLPSFCPPCSLAVLPGTAVAMGLPPEGLGAFSESPCTWHSQPRAQGEELYKYFLMALNKIHTALQYLTVEF